MSKLRKLMEEKMSEIIFNGSNRETSVGADNEGRESEGQPLRVKRWRKMRLWFSPIYQITQINKVNTFFNNLFKMTYFCININGSSGYMMIGNEKMHRNEMPHICCHSYLF